jgi:hypothetical protein
MSREGQESGGPWRAVSWIAGGAVSLPVVVGFVLLGATVIMARSVRDLGREAWAWLPGRRASPNGAPRQRDSNAA